MKNYIISVSVNNCEFLSTVKITGNKIEVLHAFEDACGFMRYPVRVDNTVLTFDEYVVSIVCDGEEIYHYE